MNVYPLEGELLFKVKKNKLELLACMNGVQRCMHDRVGNVHLFWLESKLQKELSHINYQEELIRFQRSRVKWLMDGDRHTRYYHLKVVTRKRKNHIVMLQGDNGEWVENSDDVKMVVNGYFQNIFLKDNNVASWFQMSHTYPAINTHKLHGLDEVAGDDEVKQVVFWGCGKCLDQMVYMLPSINRRGT